MPKKDHDLMTSPCNECPFRLKSLPGYVGGHGDMMEITDLLQHDQKFPCHMQVSAISEHLLDATDGDGDLGLTESQAHNQACLEAKHCAGALYYMNGSAKRSRDEKIASLQDAARALPRDDVFTAMPVLLQHHRSARWAAIKAKMPKSQRAAINKQFPEPKAKTKGTTRARTKTVDRKGHRKKTVRKRGV